MCYVLWHQECACCFSKVNAEFAVGLKKDTEQGFVDVYLEDIIVFSRTFSDHLINLQRVFECLKEAGLKLNQEEMQVLLFRSGVLYIYRASCHS